MTDLEAAVKDASVAEEKCAALVAALQKIADLPFADFTAQMIANDALAACPKSVALRPVVWAFAHAMEAKLSLHDEKRGPRGWMGDKERGFSRASPLWLMSRLSEETGELRRSLTSLGPSRILEEAADVANMAMMVADVCDAVLVEDSRALAGEARRT